MNRSMFAREKLLWYILLTATMLDLLIPFLLAPFYKGYSHKKMVMSALGNTSNPYHVIYNIWLITLGIILSVCAVQVFIALKDISLSLSTCIALVILIFAVGACIISGFFPVNETKQTVTTASKIHGVGASIGFMVMLFLPLLFSFIFSKSQDKIGVIVSTVSFFLGVISFAFFVMSDKEVFANSYIDNEGIWQRVALLFMYLPLDYYALTKLNVMK